MKTIQTAAKITGLSVPTLRYYDELGLLPHLKRDENGYRQFSDQDISDINLVKCFREVGVPIKQIKKIIAPENLDQQTIEQRLQVLKAQQEALLSQRRQIEISLLALQIKTARYQAILTDPSRVDHGEAELVQFCVKYAKPEQQSYVAKTLTTLFEQFKQHQTQPVVLTETYVALSNCFEPAYLPEVKAAFNLLTGLQY